jgi:hypothetical protein
MSFERSEGLVSPSNGMRGSHVFLKHQDGRATSVPVHSGETLGPGLLRAILRDVEMSVEELISLI